MNARGAETAALGDVDRANGFGLPLQRAPQPEPFENALRAVGERRHAPVEARRLERRGLESFDEHDIERQLGERACERRADQPAADDEHVRLPLGRHSAAPMSCSTSSTEDGNAAVSTSGSLRVTTTSSSIRMPMPRQRLCTPLAVGDT